MVSHILWAEKEFANGVGEIYEKHSRMGAIVLDGAVIEDNCIIGAGALVTQNKVIPEGSLVLGNPAKVVREITEEEKKAILENADEYSSEAQRYLREELD